MTGATYFICNLKTRCPGPKLTSEDQKQSRALAYKTIYRTIQFSKSSPKDQMSLGRKSLIGNSKRSNAASITFVTAISPSLETTKMRAVKSLTERHHNNRCSELVKPAVAINCSPRISLKVNPLNATYFTRLPPPCNPFLKLFKNFFLSGCFPTGTTPRKRTVKIWISFEVTSGFLKKISYQLNALKSKKLRSIRDA